LLGHKTQKREAAQRAASLFWVWICFDPLDDSYIKKNLNLGTENTNSLTK
jgi:hypothetical protein